MCRGQAIATRGTRAAPKTRPLSSLRDIGRFLPTEEFVDFRTEFAQALTKCLMLARAATVELPDGERNPIGF